ncbi:MAG TPA: NepR family anti-sigma factor [Sphingomicrobium sp.]|nr:NepR family anti-sigma factor [Sphingomicrobium sp.]
MNPREGGERLSAKARGRSDGTKRDSRRAVPPDPNKKTRKARSADLGRALRSVYDDTLRETVPDEFLNLLGKLN